jgi:hypothetical protein
MIFASLLTQQKQQEIKDELSNLEFQHWQDHDLFSKKNLFFFFFLVCVCVFDCDLENGKKKKCLLFYMKTYYHFL